MSLRRVVLSVASIVLSFAAVRSAPARPATNDSSEFAATDAQILDEIRDHSEVMANLEYLSDEIGPRLTGSPQLKQANDWTADMFRKYGLTNVHLEAWTIARSWARGTARARVISPTEHPLTIASAGWSPGTNGALRGPLVYFDAETKEEFEKFHGKLKGAILIYQEPASLSPPNPDNPSAAITRPMQMPPALKGQPPVASPFAALRETAREPTAFFKKEGVAAVLRDSDKPQGLLNMTGIGGESFDIGAIPTAFITGEGYRMLFRMLKRGGVEVEIEMSNAFGDKPAEVYNTIAELRGSEKPDEVVILGAHLDSWDLGTGSTDNGTGSMAVLEAARALAKLNLKPKRTIRFVLFSGEEQGLVGSKKYVAAHKDELDKVSGVLVHDTGTGRVLTLGLHENYQDRQVVDQVLGPLDELNLLEPKMSRSFGTDHASFNEVGVPGFYCIQNGAEYPKTHHSQADTFDKVWKDDLNQGAQVLAAWAYNTAQLPAMLPRRGLPHHPSSDAAKSEASKPDPIAEMDRRILEQVKAGAAELKSNLQFLADRIGPRLTGSSQLDQASHWTLDRFKEIGLANAHLEPWSIANSWTRGPASGRIVSPAVQALTLATAGWSPSTPGTVRGPVVSVAVEKPEDLENYKGKLHGAIVVVGPPSGFISPDNPLLMPWREATIPVSQPKNAANRPFDFAAYRRLRQAQSKFFASEGVVAVLNGSDKAYGLLNMSVTAIGRDYAPGLVPTAYITDENRQLLRRLLEEGPVEVEVNIESNFSGKPVEVYNTVAEIPGSERPEEAVILGAHLDSWDLGTGATDNGTGSAAVLAAARALQALGVKPKRTIRFVLFTGEEQGLNGSRAYVKAHEKELEKISGVLVHDSGTGKVLTIGLMANYAARETIDRALFPLASGVGFSEPTLRTEGGSDHVPFDEAGVPAFWCVQDGVDYAQTHHSQGDTLDRVRWHDLMEGAQVLAVFAYNVAQLPELLPRKSTETGAN